MNDRMCRHFLGTLQVHLTSMDGENAKFCMEQNWPCKLYDGIHAIKGLSRIYTGL
ncbi:hypothetical protein JK628_02500 [Shewanella sp. KX20019]|uniref:hypothetical protein n=1 Tax=Shewanella sp. KX20019 TaxID=2803864 RepID=UPI0019257F39|nr:hypothetical protein [Shewanella sp. KX20019]QQX80764.1 hypothetical protein JK628_02500 [Shewanella sp. KX20019]